MLDLHKDSGIALDLKKHEPDLKKVKILLNWDMHPVHGSSLNDGFDLDLWAFALDQNGKITSAEQVVYFNQKNFANGAIILPRDNRTGDGDDDEEIRIDLEKIPSNISTIAIYTFVFDAVSRKQHFGMIANANVKVVNEDNNNIIVQYNITQDCNGQTALCIGNLNRTSFTPVGDAGTMDPNEVLNYYA